MDRLESMEIFVRVVERGGFAAVAKERGLSPTMVAKHIRFLEMRLGARLLNRTTRKHSLTEAGALYLEKCHQVLAAAASAEERVEMLRDLPRGVLRIASPVTFGTQALVPALASFLKTYPEISIQLTLNDRAIDLVEEGIDALIQIGKLRDSGLIACPLLPYKMVIAASPAYLARHGVPRKPLDLRHHNCLGFTYWDRRGVWSFATGNGKQRVPVRGNFAVNQGYALRMAALAGIGIVMQPELLLADDVEAKRLVSLMPRRLPPARTVNLLFQRDPRTTPKLRAFIDFMTEHFGASRRNST